MPNNLSNTNKERNQLKTNQISMVKDIRNKHRTANVKKIQSYLKTEYGIEIGIRTIHRYNKIIDKEKKKITAEKVKITKNKKINEQKPSTTIECPGCKSIFKKPTRDNVTLTCLRCAKTYHPKQDRWYDEKLNHWDDIITRKKCVGVKTDYRM